MTASGITRRRLPAANDVRCLLHDPRVPELARRWQTTRTAAAVSLWGSDLEGAVVAIGNAPTALFHLLEVIAAGGPRPAADRRHPGRFRRLGGVQDRAWPRTRGKIPYVVVHGRRGGSALAPPPSTRWPGRRRSGDRSALRGRRRSRRPGSADREGVPPHRVGGRDRLSRRPPRVFDRPLASSPTSSRRMLGRSSSRTR